VKRFFKYDLGELPNDFDPDVYLKLHPDVEAAGVDPARHYLEYGIGEKRAYKISNPASIENELASFLTVEPTEQNAFDLFPDAWSSTFDSIYTKGNFPATKDARIEWLLTKTELNDKQVLELGPLEAGHTLMLENAGARVLAVEANKGAFVRCLIVKNQFDLRAKFLLGDFQEMDLTNQNFELVVASGVLYHMDDPVGLLKKLSLVTDKLFLWTHYFEPDFEKWNSALKGRIEDGKWDYQEPEIAVVDGFEVRLVKQYYKEALDWSGFCGGPEVHSKWIFKEDLCELLRVLGFNKIELSFDDVGHQNGPSFCIFAEK
tara:strand:+ start:1351 stop:2301 length:951 start_codon:yes stop_codon:yes gene_type:complete